MKNIPRFLWFIIAVLVLGFAGYVWWSGQFLENETSSPDPIPAGWERAADAASGIAFGYPAELGTVYIHPVDWPPRPEILREFTCVTGGSGGPGESEIRRQLIGERQYCVTEASEGAAGSVYTDYAYAFVADGGTVRLSFNLRFVQCDNYDEPAAQECWRERENFDVDQLGARLADTVRVNGEERP